MNISYNWLTQFIDVDQTPDELGKLLTSTGLEVDGIDTIEAVPGGLTGVVIGTVLTCERHPDADKLSLTTVDVGGETPLSIVCGAPNVAAGQRVVVATVGATLHPSSGEPFQIKRAKIRGAASEGMLCAEDEIGLGTSHDGIMVLTTDVPNGTAAARYFQLEADHRIEIGLTPNRADAASHLGVARDLRALLGKPVKWPSIDAFKVDSTEFTIQVRVEDTAACPRYMGLTLSNLHVGESPEWLKKRLLSIGLTPINNIVDVTNFVCHGLGQPMHAFDAAAITTGEVVVKTLPAGTPFTTLDGVDRKLTPTDLMICNGDAEPMCIGGVFGGKTSGVSAETTRIFLECAYFSPASIRKTAQQHGLKTDASFRYERGTDPNMPPFALRFAALLIQEVAGGQITSDVIDVYPTPIADFRVPVTYRNIDRLIGIQIDRQRMHDILYGLDIQTDELTESGFVAVVPPYRVDVTREADVVEEILRIYGLDNVPLSASLAADTLSEFPEVDVNQLQARIGTVLAATGFVEAMSLSMTRPAYHEAIRATLPLADVRLLNPLSEELSVLRQSMVFSMLDALVYNLNRRQRDLSLFEFGKVYGSSVSTGDNGTGATKYHESPRLALVMAGNTTAETWQQPGKAVAFHDMAAAVNRVLSSLRIKPTDQQPADPTLFQYGLTYTLGKKPVVTFGLLNPKLAKLADAKVPVYYADFDWALLTKRYSGKASYAEVSRFPEVRRDLSLVIDRSVSFAQIEQVARQTERKLLTGLNVFDVYEGANLGAGKKAYAVSFTLQDATQTLTDAVIDKTMQRLMAAFERELGATIRK
ncbi:phenylalanyl-tRNA synthetase, beta subunit [Fibrella aestuarina BUZ 2]|uniref:Phenylalanine--tRNA ligase beta subunit n=1 Tax=Fibrella aestuarina BUZ 2 TaxID=1166018 RepID=I0K5I4_9BACT|nr:phenylalanine--tRNA ligase subunit beta [Fibrella aestuarina]CCG99387.1 phenylalanyl-tRNA synthetase, beta subunit [Fibrella aestuarina BUZ 2]